MISLSLPHEPTVIVIFGASGDLTQRKVLPALRDWQPNRVVIRIQPQEGALLHIQAKQRGLTLRLSPVDMHFTCQEAFQTPSPDAYETLLLDVMIGDATLFMRADQVEAAWSVVTPILEGWESVERPDFPNYSAGTWGPPEADQIIAGAGGWHNPKPEEAPE